MVQRDAARSIARPRGCRGHQRAPRRISVGLKPINSTNRGRDHRFHGNGLDETSRRCICDAATTRRLGAAGDRAIAEGRKRYYRSHREGTAAARCHGRLCLADFLLSLLISLITVELVYFSLQWFMVRLMRRLTDFVGFREDPVRREPRIASVETTG